MIENLTNIGKKLYDNIFSYFLIFSICIGGYVLPNTSFSLGLFVSFVFSVVVFLYYIIAKKHVFLFDKGLFLFIFYIFFSQLVLSIASGEIVIIKRLFIVIVTSFTIFVFYNLISEESFLKAYEVIGIICSIGLLYQALMVYILKHPVSPIVILSRVFVPKTNWASNILRPMSFFQEPQAYATFMLPLLAYTLNHKKYLLSIFFVICIFLSTSTTGVIMAVGICLYTALIINKHKLSSYIFLIIMIIIFLLIVRSDIFIYTINKVINISFNNERLSNGFTILKNLDYKQLIFGVGAGNIYNIMFNQSIKLPKYYSTFSGIIIDYGILGLFLYCFMLYRLFRRQNKIGRLFVIMIFILSFTQTILFNTAFVNFYTAYFICSLNEEKNFYKLVFNSHKGGEPS
ncbi:MAG: hypothetical protein AAGU76_07905 [Sedimentibacter sp.]|uniref:hypothetical protein n=1 Tax=Sedimentibacter sp. TaxID=1960295 RepID=UPI003159121A